MSVKTTTVPSAATGTAQHGCCGGETAAETRTETPAHADHGQRAHAERPKAAKSSCCCGTTKASDPAGPAHSPASQ